MQFLTEVKEKVAEFASENATTLLTAGGVVGTVATAVLAGRAGFKLGVKATEIRSEKFQHTYENDEITVLRHETEEWIDIVVPKKDLVIATAPELIPPVVTGAATIAAIVFSHRMSSAKIAGLAAAYGLAERNLSEYREKVAEKLTGPKKTQIDDEIAQERLNKAGPSNLVIIEGEVLCYDEATNRYFRGTMEGIRKAVNATNEEILHHDHADATFFYNELGLAKTAWSEEVGWNNDNLLELKYTTAEAPDGRPCISINFATFPRQDYIPKHY